MDAPAGSRRFSRTKVEAWKGRMPGPRAHDVKETALSSPNAGEKSCSWGLRIRRGGASGAKAAERRSGARRGARPQTAAETRKGRSGIEA